MTVEQLARLMRKHCEKWYRTTYFEWVTFRNDDAIVLDCDFDEDKNITRVRVLVNNEITTVIKDEVFIFVEDDCIKLASGNSINETRIIIFN